MKFKVKHTIKIMAMVGVLGMAACNKTDLPRFDQSFAGIYFQQDSLYYSFGVTQLDVTEYQWQVPLRVMGEPAQQDREFSVVIDAEHTTAIENNHFKMPSTLTVKADSVNAYLPVQLIREALGEDDFKLRLTLTENTDFIPVNNPFTTVTLHFNNRVEPPSGWVDFRGDITWPSGQLGPWNPLTYIKFIEYFREIEGKSPATYQNMVDEFGPDLENVEFGWPWDYNHTMTKYVLIPLYQYFMEENPDLGVTIPRPSGY